MPDKFREPEHTLARADLKAVVGRERALIGMVHIGALPGTPRHTLKVDQLVAQAAIEARQLEDAGFDAIMIENMHDVPYMHGHHGPEITAAMTRVASEVRAVVDLPLGVQILSGGQAEALATAQAAGGSFIRCENFVYAHVADEGLLSEACAGELLRYRRSIGAEQIAICCDLKKKHASHAITADMALGEMVHAAEFFGADAVIVTGGFTGQPVDEHEFREVCDAATVPVIVGSGVNASSVGPLLSHADCVIVGSSIKYDGTWRNPVDPGRAAALVKAAKNAQ